MEFMEMDNDSIITRRDIDSMTDEELLPFARKHAQLLGDRFTRKMENFYSPTILDEPYFLHRLCRLDREQFTRLTQEQSKREYMAAGRWAAVLLAQGGTIPEDVLRKQEKVMPAAMDTDTITYRHSLDSALFLDVSEQARKLWAAQPALYQRRMTQCSHLSKALELRKIWLGKSHSDSAEVFYSLGWKPLDVMLAYLAGEISDYDEALDPDCAVAAARRDPDIAVWLMDPDHYRAYFDGELHPSYDFLMAKTWTELLYFHGGWTDRSPLEKRHRLKKTAAFYREVLERLNCPDYPRRTFEVELCQAGLLPTEESLDRSSPKLAKRQRLALTKALVCHYQWRVPELLEALSAGKPESFTTLVWGLYQKDRLIAAFMLDASKAAWDQDGQPMALPLEGLVGLVSPTELDKKQLALWKKRIKTTGGKPPIRQLTLPSSPMDLQDLEGAITKHITLFTTAGKWGMDMGTRASHCRADLTDPLHGYGARVRFDRVWNGPEYNSDDVTLLGAEFYRLDPIPFGEYLPLRAVAPPESLPLRFTAAASAAFRQLAGIK